MGALLLRENGTVTTVHSRTKNMKEITKQADILVVAIGKPEFIDASYVKEGAVIIDVGINYKDGKQYGDCSEELRSEKYNHCFDITPRIGGVGLLTRAKLMENVAISCYGDKEYWFK